MAQQIAEVWVADNRLRSGPGQEGAPPVPVRDAATTLLGAPDHTRLTVEAHGVNLQILRHMLETGGRVRVRRVAG